MKRSELTEFAVEEEGFKLKIRRGSNGLPIVSGARGGSNAPFPLLGDTVSSSPPQVLSGGSAAIPSTSAGEEVGITYIKSPMVGTFYRSPSPESGHFVENGAKVSETTVVCIIEAMKIMNEIQAETKGILVEALVENGQPVEYGQKLFRLKQG